MIRRSVLALPFLLGFLYSPAPSWGQGKSEPALAPTPVWKAAAHSVKITPEKPMWMAGYASRKTPSDGVLQDLYAKCLVLEDAKGKRLVILTMDLIGIPASLRQAVEEAGQKKHGLPPGSIVMNASHTHCGPEFRIGAWRYLEGMEHKVAEAEEYGKLLRDRLIKLMDDAIAKLAQAQVHHNRARCGFAMNRRLPSRLGYKNSPYPDGPVDHDVPVLEVSSADGKQLVAVLFGYACHNTTLGIQQFCGDYAGYAQEELEKAHPGTVALFMTGCGGDQNPYPRREIDHAKTHGKTLAMAVETALQVVPKQPTPSDLKMAFERVTLDFATPPTKEELETKAKSTNTYEAGHAQRLLAIIKNEGKLPTSYPYPVQVIHFGDALAMVTLGGEVVVDYSLRLKRELKHPMVWVCGYSNDVMGYIPSLRVLKEGGYEAGGAMMFGSHPGAWSEAVEETIIGKVKELDEKLGSVGVSGK
jgi:neutral ceramidase